FVFDAGGGEPYLAPTRHTGREPQAGRTTKGAQQLAPRPERRRRSVSAATPRDANPHLRGGRGKYLGQACFANPRLAEDKRRSPTTGARLFQPRQQSLDLLTTTYEFADVRLASRAHLDDRTRPTPRLALAGP